MKRWIKIFCAVLALLAILLAGLYWWQRENVKAVKDAVSYTSEELEEKLADNQQVIRDAVEAAPEITVREVTEEERQALRDGIVTQEELVERLLDTGSSPQVPVSAEAALETEKPQTLPEPSAVPADPVSPAEQVKPAENTYQKELSALIAKVYVLREEYTAALDNMYEEAKAEYKALPASKRTKSNLAKVASDYLAKASALEKECDSKMDQIIAEMETLIHKNNGDKSLPDTVFNTYLNEKSLKKSWYMSKLQEKGLV